jgi:folate-binding protein YgfZ
MLPLQIKQLTPLSNWSVITVTGADATEFLQSQLTNSVKSIKSTPLGQIAQLDQGSRFSGYCSAKGRLMASFWISRYDVTTETGETVPQFQLALSSDLAAQTAKRLSMFVLRAKVKVLDQTDQVLSFAYTHESQGGVTDPVIQALQSIHGTTESIRLVELPPVSLMDRLIHRHIITLPKADATALAALNKLTHEHQLAPEAPNSGLWDWLEVKSAIPRVTLPTFEQFVPQMINMESLRGIDFQKGCYPGQEVVARSQYRGTIKRRLQLASTKATEIPPAGTEIFHSADPEQPCGMVVMAAHNPSISEEITLQVECKLEAMQSGSIHLKSTQGSQLRFEALPYPLIEI